MNGSYVDWGVVHISIANLVVLAVMVVTFLIAALVPFPGTNSGDGDAS